MAIGAIIIEHPLTHSEAISKMRVIEGALFLFILSVIDKIEI
jgi:hypothetical protein